MQRYRTSLLLLTALSCATVAQAQSSLTSGALKGTVRAKGAGVVVSATVTIRNQETGLSRTTTSNAQGEFTFSLLPIGPYDVTVQAKGMSSVKDSSLRVNLGQATTTTFTLDKSEAAATVVVLGSVQGLDATQVGLRWSMVTWLAVAAMAGTRVIAVAPEPMTTTRLSA